MLVDVCMNKSMLDLCKKLELLERGEKREKMDSNWISCLSLLYIFFFLSSLFHVNILLYLHKRSSGNRFLVYVCLPKTRNLSSLLRVNLVASLFLVGLFWKTKASEQKKKKKCSKKQKCPQPHPGQWSQYHWLTSVSPFYTQRECK